jgi:large subunit ribosomal protein L17
MRHQVSGRKLSRLSSHRWALYRNLVTDLLSKGKIITTEAKAKEIRSLAERMITLGKDGTLASRRRALAFSNDKRVIAKLFEEIGPGYSERAGGYTRLVKLGPRKGDNAAMAQIELVK